MIIGDASSVTHIRVGSLPMKCQADKLFSEKAASRIDGRLGTKTGPGIHGAAPAHTLGKTAAAMLLGNAWRKGPFMGIPKRRQSPLEW